MLRRWTLRRNDDLNIFVLKSSLLNYSHITNYSHQFANHLLQLITPNILSISFSQSLADTLMQSVFDTNLTMIAQLSNY